jgi:hypothetical protein
MQRWIVAEYEKVALEVDAEILYLNTVGLRALGVWLGIREARLESQGRVDVLRDVRAHLVRWIDSEDSIEGKTGLLRAMRDQIHHLMQEPDNWDQTSERNRAMREENSDSVSTVSRQEDVSEYAPPPHQQRVRPVPRPRPAFISTPAPPVSVSEVHEETPSLQHQESIDLDSPHVDVTTIKFLRSGM